MSAKRRSDPPEGSSGGPQQAPVCTLLDALEVIQSHARAGVPITDATIEELGRAIVVYQEEAGNGN